MADIGSACRKAVAYVHDHSRYFAAGLVGVCMVVMLGKGIDAMAVEKDPVTNVYEDYSDEGENEELKSLLTSYYKACAADDTEALSDIAKPISESELSYIAMMSEYVDSYDVKEIYTKEGLTQDSYLVSVAVDIHFKDIETPAPGLDFFYVESDVATKKPYINNLYSTYNLNNAENPVDSKVATMIAEFEQQDDVVALQNRVQKEYNAATIEDASLKTFIESTLQEKIGEWASNYQKQKSDEAAAAAKAEADKKAAEAAAAEKAAADKKAAEEAAAAKAAQDAAAKAAAEEAAKGFDVIVTRDVNVRQGPGEDTAQIGRAAACTKVKKHGDEGEWSKIDYNGQTGYIKTMYLCGITNTTPRQVTLTGSVNIRAGLDETSQKLTLLSAGTVVNIVEDYTVGWSKVQIGDNAFGYGRTEYLK